MSPQPLHGEDISFGFSHFRVVLGILTFRDQNPVSFKEKLEPSIGCLEDASAKSVSDYFGVFFELRACHEHVLGPRVHVPTRMKDISFK